MFMTDFILPCLGLFVVFGTIFAVVASVFAVMIFLTIRVGDILEKRAALDTKPTSEGDK